MKQIRNSLWGLVFIILGLVVGLNALGITNINLFFKGWWTLFIIVPCFIDLFKEKNKIGNVIGLIFGILLLLSCYDLFSFDIVFWVVGERSLTLQVELSAPPLCLLWCPELSIRDSSFDLNHICLSLSFLLSFVNFFSFFVV